jgi:hypothetical protein
MAARTAQLLLPALVVAFLALAIPRDVGAATAWAQLSPVQQQALAPLQADWDGLETDRRAKWLEVASRFPTLNAAERQRLHSRMAEWVRLSPNERRSARLQFQEARRVSPEDRQAAWKAYQALPEEERQRLAQRSKPAAPRAGAPTPAAKATPTAQPKVNVVQAPSPVPAAASVRSVAPSTRQARPGATTSPITQPALPPAAIQHGLPKIATTPSFVDPSTLLPRRGPQGAAAAPRQAAVKSAGSASSPAAAQP